MKKSLKKSLALFLSILMVFSLFGATLTTVSAADGTPAKLYMTPNSNWTQANARFAAYFFGNGDKWVSMTASDAQTGVYEVDVPSGYPNVIFCRMNPSATANNWNNKWNQTADLVIPTDGTNHYTVKSGTWDSGGGTWSTIVVETEPASSEDVNPDASEDVTPEDTTPVETTPEDTEAPVSITTYCINSANWDAVCAHAWIEGGAGTSWPGIAMTNTGTQANNGADIYEITVDVAYENIIFNNNNKGAQTANLTLMEGQYYDVKTATWYETLEDVPTVDPLSTDRYLVGGFNGWSTTANEFKLNAEGETKGYVSMELEAATTYEFKVVRQGAWTSYNGTITGSAAGLQFSSSNSANAKITTTEAGTYLFAFGLEDSKLDVVYPGESIDDATEPEVFEGYTVAGSETLLGVAWNPAPADNNVMTDEDGDGIFTLVLDEVAAGDYEFKVTDGTWDNSWGGNPADTNENYALSLVVKAKVTITFDSATNTVTAEIEYLEELPSVDPDATEPEPTPVEYCLFGYINGANYGCEEDYETVGDYVFVDGTLVATFDGDSYVAVKTTDNNSWYMFPDFVQDKTGTLEVASDTINEKMFIPGGVEVTFTLVANEDGTLTLTADYVTPETEPSSSEDETTDTPEGTTPVETEPVVPVETTTLYLLPNSNWNTDGARYAAYAYDADGNYTWIDMTDENADGVYEVAVPTTYATVIFCRMNPNTTENNWDNKWNQTDNCVVDGTWNTAIITGWDKEFVLDMVDYENGEVPTQPVIEFKGYSVAGDEGLTGFAWNKDENFMTANEDGTYFIRFTDVAAGTYGFKVTDGTWTNAWPAENYVLTVEALANVTITFNPTTTEITATVETIELPTTPVETEPAETEPSNPDETEPSDPAESDPADTEPSDPVESDPAAEATTLYLLPNSNWNTDTARFAAYFFNDAGNTWVGMTDENADGVYEVVVPEGYGTVIFCRMNPSTTENNWDNKWNQTSNLVIDGTWNTAIITGWDAAEVLDMVDYENGEVPTEPTVEFKGYSVAGDAGLVGVAWDPAQNFMNDDDADGIWTITFTEVAAGDYGFKVTDGSWNNAWPGENYALSLPVLSNVTITFDSTTYTVNADVEYLEEVVPTDPVPVDYYLFGYINGANYGCDTDYENMGEYKFVDGTLTTTFEADSYVAVKSANNANWYMFDAYVPGNTGTLKNTSTGTSEKMFVPGGVEVTFTLVDNGDDTFTLSYKVNATVIGDIDGDGEVSINDATDIQRYLAKLDTLDAQAMANADVNGDGKVTVRDVTYIQMVIAKIIETFPVA